MSQIIMQSPLHFYFLTLSLCVEKDLNSRIQMPKSWLFSISKEFTYETLQRPSIFKGNPFTGGNKPLISGVFTTWSPLKKEQFSIWCLFLEQKTPNMQIASPKYTHSLTNSKKKLILNFQKAFNHCFIKFVLPSTNSNPSLTIQLQVLSSTMQFQLDFIIIFIASIFFRFFCYSLKYKPALSNRAFPNSLIQPKSPKQRQCQNFITDFLLGSTK